jgi:branched-chain amino acid transport system substrate-binding protein
VQQWDGKAWKVISDWYTANQEITEPLVKDVSAKYAAEKKIEVRDCSKES